MNKYIKGKLKNLFNPAVAFLCLIDDKSFVNKKAKIYSKTQIFDSKIDKYSYIGYNLKIICAEIGRFCSISGSCIIGLGNHPINTISTSPIFYSKKNGTGTKWVENSHFQEYKKVVVGNDVWIGTGVIVMGGVTIGDGAIIGAGALVTKDVPPYSIVAGVTAKVIKYRFEDDVIQKLLKINWWNFDETLLRKNIHLFQSNNISSVVDDLMKFE